MSIKLMSMVWDRYSATGGELLLALALADYAHDNGTSVYAGVETLAQKTRQSVRTVQYQLRRMQEEGWLLKVGKGDGGRSRHVTYHINPKWIKGAEVAPFVPDEEGADSGDEGGEPGFVAGDGEQPLAGVFVPLDGAAGEGVAEPSENGANGPNGAATVAPFAKTERVQPDVLKGAIAVAPAITNHINHHYSPISPQEGKHDLASSIAKPSKPTGALARPETGRQPRGGKQAIGLQAYLDACREAGCKPVPPTCAVFAYCDKVGIPREILALHWAEFKLRHLDSGRRQKDWLKTLQNSVRSNWYGIWFIRAGGECALTTKGLQAQADHRENEA